MTEGCQVMEKMKKHNCAECGTAQIGTHEFFLLGIGYNTPQGNIKEGSNRLCRSIRKRGDLRGNFSSLVIELIIEYFEEAGIAAGTLRPGLGRAIEND